MQPIKEREKLLSLFIGCFLSLFERIKLIYITTDIYEYTFCLMEVLFLHL